LSEKYKFRGISNSLEKFVKVHCRCEKGHYKKKCISKIVEKRKGSTDAPSIK